VLCLGGGKKCGYFTERRRTTDGWALLCTVTPNRTGRERERERERDLLPQNF
jgi:hypothetical protein